MKILEVNHLVRKYRIPGEGENQEITVLKDMSFSVEEGEFVGIMGKSGSGKTTLLKVLGLIDKPTEGNLQFEGQDTETLYPDELADIRRNKIGFIFQDFYLMDSLTVEENIMLPMILGKGKSQIIKERVHELSKRFQIENVIYKHPYELSGGEKQRAAISRALMNEPDLILADEPTGNLDSRSGKIVIESLANINQSLGKTIVLVTHDPMIASYCSKIIFLKDGIISGTLERQGDQEQFHSRILEYL